MAFAEAIPPLVAYGTHARWMIHTDNAAIHLFYQVGPQTTDPAIDVMPFLKAIADCIALDKTPVLLPVPGCGLKGPYRPIAQDERKFAAIMYSFWAALTPRVRRPRIAYDWQIWPDMTASFRSYSATGDVVPFYDLERKPLDDLAFDLAIYQDMTKLRHSL